MGSHGLTDNHPKVASAGALNSLETSSNSAISIDSRHSRQTPRRVRHKLQVYQRRLYRAVPQPARQMVDGDPIHQQVPCVAVAQRVGAGPLPRRNRAQFFSTFHRGLHPAPCGSGMCLYDSALADVPVSQGIVQRSVQLRMHRHKPCLAALTGTYSERGLSVSSDRSRTSRSRASDTSRPARHCCSISSFAYGLGAALMMAFTSSASRYSGMRFSRLGAAPSCVLG